MSASLDRLGAEIRAARTGVAMREVARRAGISVAYLCDIENGRRAPAVETLHRIAECLGATPSLPRWLALCGRMPEDIERAILAAPERWDALRAWLAKDER